MAKTLDTIVQKLNTGKFREAGELIEKALREEPDQVLQHRIDLANWLILAANWPYVTNLLMPRTNFLFESGWLESLLRQKAIDKTGAPIPWFTYPALDFLEPRIRREFRVFEYGAGSSTLWWAKRVASLVGVTHEEKALRAIQAQLPPRAFVSVQEAPDAYVGALPACGGEFDIVVVAGEHRNACALAAAKQLKPTGLIVFDNSDRASSSDGVRALSESGWLRVDFFGLIPGYPYKNCTSLFFRDPQWLGAAPLPAEQSSSIGPSCAQAIKT